MAGASLLLCVGWPGYGALPHANPTADLLWARVENSSIIPPHVTPEVVQEQPFQRDAAGAGWGLTACWNPPGTLAVIYSGLYHSIAKQRPCYAALMNRSSLFSSCWHDWTNFPVCFLHQDVWSLKNNYISSVMSYRWSSWESDKRKQYRKKVFKRHLTLVPPEKQQR